MICVGDVALLDGRIPVSVLDSYDGDVFLVEGLDDYSVGGEVSADRLSEPTSLSYSDYEIL